jgi:hypothetical protein
VTEAVPNTYWLSTGDYSRILYVSPSYEKMWGRSREEFLKNPPDNLAAIHPDDAKFGVNLNTDYILRGGKDGRRGQNVLDIDRVLTRDELVLLEDAA